MRANNYFQAHQPEEDSCKWTRATYMIGLMDLFRATSSQKLYDYAVAWAKKYEWKLCSKKEEGLQAAGPKPIKPKGKDDADNQLCAATYAELYTFDPEPKHLADAIEVLGKEADGKKDNYWSWIDAIHMGMNAYSRIGNATGDDKYFEAMFRFYNKTANAGSPPDGVNTFHMWNESRSLFYRDDRFLSTNNFWARGNGWAITAMARSLEVLPMKAKFAPHREEYSSKLVAMSHKLKSIQSGDGCWRASLLNATSFPSPETTGTANFVYGIAFGINTGLLSKADFLPVVEKGWTCLSKTVLHSDGLVGYCQPVGYSPAATTSTSTNDFCVGQFLLAATQVAKLSQQQATIVV